jgi:hypothetical protein
LTLVVGHAADDPDAVDAGAIDGAVLNEGAVELSVLRDGITRVPLAPRSQQVRAVQHRRRVAILRHQERPPDSDIDSDSCIDIEIDINIRESCE